MKFLLGEGGLEKVKLLYKESKYRGEREGARVSDFFTKNPILKQEKKFGVCMGGVGWGEWGSYIK